MTVKTPALVAIALAWTPLVPMPVEEPEPEPLDLSQHIDTLTRISACFDRANADDFLSDLVVYASERIDRYDPSRGEVGTWLWSQARAVHTQRRRRHVRTAAPLVYSRARPESSEECGGWGCDLWDLSPHVPQRVPDSDSVALVREIIDGADEREALWIRAQLLGATSKETEQETGLDARTVRRYGAQLRHRLQEEIANV